MSTVLWAGLESWPRIEPTDVEHRHDDLSSHHSRLHFGSQVHAHLFMIDDLHFQWSER
jgi:hypothetical protein